MNDFFQKQWKHPDTRWTIIWLTGLSLLFLWDGFFLNTPALLKLLSGFMNTLWIALLVSGCALLMAWLQTNALHFLNREGWRGTAFAFTFITNILRSIPQIVGVLFAYILLGRSIEHGVLTSVFLSVPLMAFSMSLFVFIEMADMMRDRINHFETSEFTNAMRVCGISEWRIINFDILCKNTQAHIQNKLIAIFGMALFLQCSVDFIISVGLSTEVNAVNLPTTLGSLLAKVDSKQDILAIGYTVSHPFYAPHLLFTHLQGIGTAFLIVFNLLCLNRINRGFTERRGL